jgi:hypothetical protein
MKIIFASDSCPQSTCYYYERALRSLGHRVLTIGPIFNREDCEDWQNAEELNNKWKGPGRYTRWSTLKRLPQNRDYKTQAGGGPIPVAAVIKDCNDYDALIWVDAGLHRLSLDLTGVEIPSVAIVGDVRGDYLQPQMAHAKQFTQSFLQFTPGVVRTFTMAGLDTAVIPPAADRELHYTSSPVEPIWDVGFIGSTNRNWHGLRVQILEEIDKHFELKVESALHQEMALFNKRCRVLFNCSLDGDMNMRVPESMISGRPLVTDSVHGLGSMRSDKTMVTFSSPEEVIPIIKRLLDDEPWRERIGREAQNEILCRHTYQDRIKSIVNLLLLRAGG